MDKDMSNLLRFLILILIFLVIMGMALFRIHKLEKQIKAIENAPADTVTVVKHDTIKIDSPIPVTQYIKKTEYVAVHDTTLVTETDTLVKIIELPREYLVYKDSSYRAVVSGVQPRLDSMEIYQKTITNTITKTIVKKQKPLFSVGPQVSVGWDGKKVKPYVGVGIQLNLISF